MAALTDLHQQDLPDGVCLTHVIVDDGSTDGTTASVRSTFPEVEIVPGSGDLFWAGGMRHGWQQSVRRKSFDYLFVYNDDVRLERWAIADLLSGAETLAGRGNDCHAVAGSFRAAASDLTTYGGWRRSSPWHPLKFSSRIEPNGALQRADVFNMNGALISRAALEQVGFLADYFVHSAADFEFALRLVKAGGLSYVSGRHIGLCEPNPDSDISPSDPSTLRQRLNLLFDPRREPVHQRLRYYHQHAGFFWPLWFIAPYFTVWVRHLLSGFDSRPRSFRMANNAAEDHKGDRDVFPAEAGAPERLAPMVTASVTIGFTSYNAVDTILDAVRSAIAQSAPISQIVVVDDCSTDDTLSVLGRSDFASQLEIHQNTVNKGVAASRNEIISRARGEFLAFFDDDDISAPTRVEAQLTRILDYERDFANGAPVICHTARRQVYPNGLERIEPTMGMREGGPAPSGVKVARRALIGEPLRDAYGSCATCSQMARTETYRSIGGFDEAFRRPCCEDSDFAVRLALAGGHFVGLRCPLVTQTMTTASEKTLHYQRVFSLMWLDKHRTVFDSEAAYRFCRSWLEIKYDWLAGDRLGFSRRLMKLGLRHPLWVARRIGMALPTLGGNRALRTFFRGVP